ncbi:MAG: peptidase associated/transthyretin-like domain-containing protein [Armatimonadota bacterium]
MRRFLILVSVVGIIASLAGCGGGGGTTSDTTTPVLGADRVITGRIVGSQTGSPGVPGVTVSLGTLIGTTDSNGNFQLKLASGTTAIAAYLVVNTSGTDTGYLRSSTATYNGQVFLATEVTVPVGIRNGDTDALGVITIPYLENSDTPPPPAYTDKDTVLTGRIVRSDTLAGIANVSVSFGTPAYTTKTGKNGYFELNLGREAAVLPLLPGSKLFSINTSTAGSEYPSSLSVSYGSTSSPQGFVPVPPEIYTNQATDFGDITVVMGGSGGGGDGPPAGPW